MRSENEITQRISAIDAEIENIDRKQNISVIDTIHKRDLVTQAKALRWCLKRSRSSPATVRKNTKT